MLNIIAKLFVSLTICASTVFALSVDDVKMFVEKGAALCEEKGNKVCFDAFNDPNGGFIKGELYMFAYKFDGVNQSHGANPSIAGRNLFKLKDASGVLLIQALINVAKDKGNGWLDYKWSHPQTKKITPKTSYIMKLKGDYFIGAGMYK